jgi:hypothetical protein
MVLGKLYQIIVSPESEIRHVWDDLPYSNHQFPVSLLKSTIYISNCRRNKNTPAQYTNLCSPYPNSMVDVAVKIRICHGA